MNQDITTTSEPGPVAYEPFANTTAQRVASDIAAWNRAMREAALSAESLTKTTMVPEHFRGSNKIGDAAVAIMTGASLGFDPLRSLQKIYVISGRPAMYTDAMHSVVVGCGHEIWVEETSDESVTVCGKRRGSTHVERATWTIERAQRAGHTKNPLYKTSPQTMLRARALSEVCRRVAPDALMGLSYAVEELELEETSEPVKIKRRRRPEPEPEPVLDVETVDAEEADQ